MGKGAYPAGVHHLPRGERPLPCRESRFPHGVGVLPRGEARLPYGELDLPRRVRLLPYGELDLPRRVGGVPRGVSPFPHGERPSSPQGTSISPRGQPLSFVGRPRRHPLRRGAARCEQGHRGAVTGCLRLLSFSKELYARVFGTAEYVLYDPETRELEGWRLAQKFYRPIQPDESGRLWSERLGVFLGLWHDTVQRREDDWVRLFRSDGSLIPTEAEAERQQARAERQRAEAAEAENARLRALLEELGQG